jgi:hypothetical protein
MRTRSLTLLSLLAACSNDWSTAVVVTFSGDVAQPGGKYRIELRRPNGEAIPGLGSQLVDFAPGTQEVAVVVKSEEIFGDNDTLLARLYVEVVPAPDARPTSIGSRLVTLEAGESSALDLALYGDPRPIAMPIDAAYSVDDQARQAIKVSAAAPIAFADHTLHLWSREGDVLNWLQGAAAIDTTPIVLTAATTVPLIERAGLEILVTAEPGTGGETLVRSSGWLVAHGEIDPSLRGALADLLGADGAVAHVLRLSDASANHAALARGSFDAGNVRDAKIHVEHVFNTVVGPDEHADLDGDGGTSLIFSASQEPFGVLDYRDEIRTVASDVVETFGGRLADFEDIDRCATNLGAAEARVRQTAQTFEAAASGDASALTDMIAAAVDIGGIPFNDTADANQTGRCIRDRVSDMAAFTLEPIAAGQ